MIPMLVRYGWARMEDILGIREEDNWARRSAEAVGPLSGVHKDSPAWGPARDCRQSLRWNTTTDVVASMLAIDGPDRGGFFRKQMRVMPVVLLPGNNNEAAE